MVVARHTLNTVFGEQGRVRLPDAGGPLDLSPAFLTDVKQEYVVNGQQCNSHGKREPEQPGSVGAAGNGQRFGTVSRRH
jgi:hypothetical protein